MIFIPPPPVFVSPPAPRCAAPALDAEWGLFYSPGMNRDDLDEIYALADRRNEKLFAWLRWLILLAAGAFTLLLTADGTGTASNVFLKAARICMTLGILLGSAALYGEVWHARALVRRLVEDRMRPPSRNAAEPSPISVPRPWLFRIAECGCYLSLLASILSLLGYGLTR